MRGAPHHGNIIQFPLFTPFTALTTDTDVVHAKLPNAGVERRQRRTRELTSDLISTRAATPSHGLFQEKLKGDKVVRPKKFTKVQRPLHQSSPRCTLLLFLPSLSLNLFISSLIATHTRHLFFSMAALLPPIGLSICSSLLWVVGRLAWFSLERRNQQQWEIFPVSEIPT